MTPTPSSQANHSEESRSWWWPTFTRRRPSNVSSQDSCDAPPKRIMFVPRHAERDALLSTPPPRHGAFRYRTRATRHHSHSRHRPRQIPRAEPSASASAFAPTSAQTQRHASHPTAHQRPLPYPSYSTDTSARAQSHPNLALALSRLELHDAAQHPDIRALSSLADLHRHDPDTRHANSPPRDGRQTSYPFTCRPRSGSASASASVSASESTRAQDFAWPGRRTSLADENSPGRQTLPTWPKTNESGAQSPRRETPHPETRVSTDKGKAPASAPASAYYYSPPPSPTQAGTLGRTQESTCAASSRTTSVHGSLAPSEAPTLSSRALSGSLASEATTAWTEVESVFTGKEAGHEGGDGNGGESEGEDEEGREFFELEGDGVGKHGDQRLDYGYSIDERRANIS